jgi:hypothetical protein
MAYWLTASALALMLAWSKSYNFKGNLLLMQTVPIARK